MDISAGHPQVSQQERDARMREGHCFYCGGVDDMSSACPAKRRPSGYNPGCLSTQISGAEVISNLIDLFSSPPIPTRPRNPAGNS